MWVNISQAAKLTGYKYGELGGSSPRELSRFTTTGERASSLSLKTSRPP